MKNEVTMKKQICKALSCVLVFALAFSFSVAGVDIKAATPDSWTGAGEGTETSPLLIGTSTELLNFKALVEAGNNTLNAKLTADITVSDSWSSITGDYRAVFDGGGYSLYLANNQNTSYLALFHTIDSCGLVKNLVLNVTFANKTSSYAAGVAVYNYGTIDKVKVTGGISGNAGIGGIVYTNGKRGSNYGKIYNCVNEADLEVVNGTAAGIAAVFVGEMHRCANKGDIKSAASNAVGGLFSAGGRFSQYTYSVEDCYNTGNITVTKSTNSSATCGLFGSDFQEIPKMISGSKIKNIFQFGKVIPENTAQNQRAPIIGGGTGLGTDDNVIALLDNIYYLEGAGDRLFDGLLTTGANGIDGFGTEAAKRVIQKTTATEFKSQTLVNALNAGRENDEAPWEYVADGDYPTLKYIQPPVNYALAVSAGLGGTITDVLDIVARYKVESPISIAAVPNPGYHFMCWTVTGIELTAVQLVSETIEFAMPANAVTLTANFAVDPLVLLGINGAAGYGGRFTIEENSYILNIIPDDGYKIDVVYIDGVPLEGVHGETSAEIDLETGYDDVKSIVATFAYTLNFQNPADGGTLSVSRGSDTLTSGDIVYAGQILTITATPNSGYALNTAAIKGLEAVAGEPGKYKVTALRGTTPSIKDEENTKVFVRTPTYMPDNSSQNNNQTTTGKTEDKTATGDPATPATQTPAEATPSAPVIAATETVTADATIDADTGKATTTVETAKVTAAVEEAVKAVAEAKADGKANAVAEIVIPVVVGDAALGVPTAVEAVIPAEAIKAIADAKDIILTVESEISTITLDAKTLAEIASAAKDGESVKITAETVVGDAALGVPPDADVIDLSITAGGTAITDFGGNVTVSVPYEPKEETAAEDYDLLTVYHLDGDGNTQEMRGATYDAETGKITFTTTHFSKFFVTEWINPFGDISKGEWYYKAIRYAYSNGLVTGVTETAFAPQTSLTRAMLVTILHRNDGAPVGGGVLDAPPFIDVPTDAWYADAVAWASQSGVVSGIGDNKFAPDGAITREQFAAMLWRYAGEPAATGTLSGYADAGEVSGWATDAVAWAVGTGLITGRTATTLAPGGTATRAEAATLLKRYVENIG
jgi:hypothetical protein